MANNQSITENAVFFRVNFGLMGNSTQVSNREVLKTDANTKLLKIQKTLLESPELEAIKTADGKLRARVAKLCLPYVDMGIMLALNSDLPELENILKDYQETRNGLVDTYVSFYPQRVEEAKVKTQELAAELNIPFDVLWNSASYPDVFNVRKKFRFDWQYLSFMTPESLKLQGMYEQEQAKAAEKMSQAADEITLLMRSTLAELVNHLKESLEPNADGKPKRLFASAVTNIQDFVKSFSTRNITNDTELDKLVAEISTLITPELHVDTIKKDESFKASILAGVSAFGQSLNALVEEVPGRKFKEAL